MKNKIPLDMQAGTIHSTKFGDIEIVEYIDAYNVAVIFPTTGYTRTVSSDEVRKGKVVDRLYPRIYLRGFIGEGLFRSSLNRVTSKAYTAWYGMFERCYSGNYPTYNDCEVSEDWYNFQNFAVWFYSNHPDDGKDYHLDKDIKVKGNRTYGPDLCLIAPQDVNVRDAHAKHFRMKSPEGDDVSIFSMRDFCKGTDLNPAHMCSVHLGNRKSHKGWTKS